MEIFPKIGVKMKNIWNHNLVIQLYLVSQTPTNRASGSVLGVHSHQTPILTYGVNLNVLFEASFVYRSLSHSCTILGTLGHWKGVIIPFGTIGSGPHLVDKYTISPLWNADLNQSALQKSTIMLLLNNLKQYRRSLYFSMSNEPRKGKHTWLYGKYYSWLIGILIMLYHNPPHKLGRIFIPYTHSIHVWYIHLHFP